MADGSNNATLDLVGLGAEQYTDVLSGKSGDIHERMNEIAYGTQIDAEVKKKIEADNFKITITSVTIADSNNPTNEEIKKIAEEMINGLAEAGLTREQATALMQKALSGGHLKEKVQNLTITSNNFTTTEAKEVLKALAKDSNFTSGLSLGELTKLSTLMQYDQSIYDMIAASIKALLANVKKNANQLGGG